MHDSDHFISADPERSAGVYGRRGGKSQTRDGCETPLSNKIARRYEGKRGLLASLRDDGDFCAAFLQVEDTVRFVSLAIERLFRLQHDLQTSKSGTVPQQVGDSCSNLVWDSSDDDKDMVQGCNMTADWQCLRETVSYHFTRQEGDQGNAWFDLGNASTSTFVGWHFKTEHHGLGTSGKLTVTLNYQKTRNVPQTQTTDTGDLALAWGDSKILTFDPTASWKITFHQFDGVTKEYASTDETNPYIKIVAMGNQISIKALPFS